MSGWDFQYLSVPLESLVGTVGTDLFLNKEPKSLRTNRMALYLHFLIIWNNDEFSTPAKNSDSVEVGGIVDQTEPLLSFM